MKLLTQISLASLIIVKIVLGSIFIYQVELDPFIFEGNAIAAEEEQKDPEGIAKPAGHLSATSPLVPRSGRRVALAQAREEDPSRPSSSPGLGKQVDSGEAGGETENIVEAQEDPEGIEKKAENIVEEEKIDLNFLVKKKDELEKEEEELEKKRAELMAIQEELNSKIATLTELRNEIRAEMARKEKLETGKLKHLIKAYSAMKPQKAASLIEKLDMQFAVELLSNMKGDIVGGILSFVDTAKAARISEQLATRK